MRGCVGSNVEKEGECISGALVMPPYRPTPPSSGNVTFAERVLLERSWMVVVVGTIELVQPSN